MAVLLYDAAGRIVLSTSKKLTGNIYQSLDITRLGAGMYYLILTNKEKRFIRKVVIR